jgi:hypothetical protein
MMDLENLKRSDLFIAVNDGKHYSLATTIATPHSRGTTGFYSCRRI